MNSFVRTDCGLFKIYRRGLDWQVIGPEFERWFSVWQADPMGSLMRAISAAPGSDRIVEIVSLEA